MLEYSFNRLLKNKDLNDEEKSKVRGNLLPLVHDVHICMNDVPTHNA